MKHNYLKSLFLMLMMCVGMSAWAEEADYTLTPSAGSNNSYTGNCDVTVDGITWNITGNAQMTPWRLGGKSITKEDRTVYSKTAYKSAVSKVDLTVGAASSITVNSLKLVYSTNADFSNSSEISKSFAANSTISFEGDFPANAYYKFVFNVTVSVTSNKFLEFSKVEFYNTTGGGTVTAPIFDVKAGTYTEDQLVLIDNYNSDYLYAYTLDGSDPAFDAELDVTNGTLYDENEGIEITSSCTLKVIAVDEEGYASSITSAAYTINKPQVFASLEELVAADLADGTTVTVSFENVAIKSFQTVSSTRKGVYFDIQKDGKDIEIYFNSAIPAKWVEGGTLSGTLTNCPWKLYSGTWELAPASGWAWTNLTYTAAPVIFEAPTITTQPNSSTYDFNEKASSLTVSANGNPTPTYQWYSNTIESNENGTKLEGETNPSFTPSTLKAGTFYYYCVATNSEGSATSRVAKITVNEPKLASLPFEFDGGVGDIKLKDGMSQTGIGTDYSASPKLKFDSQGDYIVINFAEAAKNVTYTIKGNGTSGTYAFDVMESADGIEYTTVHSHTSILSTSTECTDNLASTSRFVKFVYTTKASGNVALGKISIVAVSTLDDPKLAFGQSTYTFFTNEDMQVVATSAAGSTGTITYALTDGDADAFHIDENTGDIVCETPGTYTVTATIAEATGFTNSTTTCTVKIKEPVVGNSIIVAKTDDRYYAMTTTCEGSYFQSKEIKKVGEKYVVNSLDDILFYTNTTEGKTTIQSTTNAQYVQATAAKNISFTETEYKWTNAEGVLTAADDAHITLQYNTSSPRFTTYTSKVGQYATIVSLDNVTTEYYTRTVTEGNYGTICLPNKVTADDLEGATIYNIAGVRKSGENITGIVLEEEEGDLAAGKPYIFKATATELVAAYTGDAVSDPISATGLVGNLSSSALDVPQGSYVLSSNTLRMVNGGTATVGQNRAYINLDGVDEYVPSAGVKAVFFGFDGTIDEETAIESINENAKESTIYNLQGQRVNKAQKGLYIVNGKKVIFK